MKSNKNKVFDFIVDYTQGFNTLEEETPKFDTQFLSSQLGMQRSNVSAILNQLVEEGKIDKTNGRPVLYSLNKNLKVQIDTQDFSSLIGSETSLKEAIQYTKAAITYPMSIPKILYIGSKGVGVETIVSKAYEFACTSKILKSKAPFIKVDCSYYSDKQLMDTFLSNENVFVSANQGVLFIKNAQVLSNKLVSDIMHYVSVSKTLNLILIVHINDEVKEISILKDYFNFIVKIPSLENRSLDERYQFIEKFIQEESIRLDKKIEVNYGLMQCLMLYPCQDNLSELKKNIQFGIANAFIRSKKNQKVVIEMLDLPSKVRKGLLYIKYNNTDIERILGKNSNFTFDHDKTLTSRSYDNHSDIYQKLDHKQKIFGKSINNHESDEFVFANIEEELIDYLNQLTEDINEDKLKEMVSDKLMSFVKDFIQRASIKFKRVYSNKIFYGMCLHLNNALIRKNSKQRITNQKIMEIMDTYDEEYLFSRRFIKQIQQEFNVKFSLDESVFITLFLTLNENNSIKKNEVITLIAMHGEQTASSIVDVIKRLMPVKNLESFNLSLNNDIEVSYDLLKKKIIDINTGKGVFVLYDMGSIQMMLNSIKDETNINIVSIEIPIPLLAMSSCQYSEEGKSLEDIYNHLIHEYTEHSYSRNDNKDIIIALSTVHENNSDSIKRYLQTLEDYSDYRILSFNISDKHHLINKINEIQIKGKIIGIVGTYNPDIFNIKYIDYSHIPKVHTIRELFAAKKENFDVVEYLTEQFEIFTYDDLQKTLIPFIDQLEIIFKNKLKEDIKIGMLIHMGCLIDRLKKKRGSNISFTITETKKKFSQEIEEVRYALVSIENYYEISFSEGDIVTIVEIIMNTRRRNEI